MLGRYVGFSFASMTEDSGFISTVAEAELDEDSRSKDGESTFAAGSSNFDGGVLSLPFGTSSTLEASVGWAFSSAAGWEVSAADPASADWGNETCGPTKNKCS